MKYITPDLEQLNKLFKYKTKRYNLLANVLDSPWNLVEYKGLESDLNDLSDKICKLKKRKAT